MKNRLLKEVDINKFLVLNTNKYNSTSILTPILAYEYYLNPESNLKRK